MLTDYDILCILETKDISTIRKAYRKIVKEIHPSPWTVETKRTLNKSSPLKEEELERIKDKVRNLVRLFPRAYYYFSIVVNEYPNSVWCQDSREKMQIIEEVPRVNRMFN